MTDSFLYPDGHHYRFLGFGPTAVSDNAFINTDNDSMVAATKFIYNNQPVFERVEPPLWPWTGPSGRIYFIDIERNLCCEYGTLIGHDDFAGLAERLAKQAKMDGDA